LKSWPNFIESKFSIAVASLSSFEVFKASAGIAFDIMGLRTADSGGSEP
jgi:hypothetical protein